MKTLTPEDQVYHRLNQELGMSAEESLDTSKSLAFFGGHVVHVLIDNKHRSIMPSRLPIRSALIIGNNFPAAQK